MLERLEITDFAVARSVVIEPGPGLTVFTGETGAGKSLVVDALAFVFGARRGREVIATGAERAVVRATVALPGGRKTIERSIALSGRTSARIDDAPATVDDLRELAAGLVDYLHVVVTPIVLGRGSRLWEGLEGLEKDYRIEAPLPPDIR